MNLEPDMVKMIGLAYAGMIALRSIAKVGTEVGVSLVTMDGVFDEAGDPVVFVAVLVVDENGQARVTAMMPLSNEIDMSTLEGQGFPEESVEELRRLGDFAAHLEEAFIVGHQVIHTEEYHEMMGATDADEFSTADDEIDVDQGGHKLFGYDLIDPDDLTN